MSEVTVCSGLFLLHVFFALSNVISKSSCFKFVHTQFWILSEHNKKNHICPVFNWPTYDGAKLQQGHIFPCIGNFPALTALALVMPLYSIPSGSSTYSMVSYESSACVPEFLTVMLISISSLELPTSIGLANLKRLVTVSSKWLID